MPGLHILLDGVDGMAKGKKHVVYAEEDITVGVLEGGMSSGKPSVSLMVDLPNGTTVIAQTSLTLFVSAAKVFISKFGDPTLDPMEDGQNRTASIGGIRK